MLIGALVGLILALVIYLTIYVRILAHVKRHNSIPINKMLNNEIYFKPNYLMIILQAMLIISVSSFVGHLIN